MRTLGPMSRVRRSAVGAVAVLGIVLASAIGLHEWADDAAAGGLSHSAAGGGAAG